MAESSVAGFLETVSEACGHEVTLDMPIEELDIDSLDFIGLAQSLGIKFDKAAECRTLRELAEAAHIPA